MNPYLHVAAVIGVAACFATGCKEEEGAAGTLPAATTGPASVEASAVAARRATASSWESRWRVCNKPDGHMSQGNEFEIVEIPTQPDHYVIAAKGTTKLGSGWASLILIPDGTYEAAMPPGTWKGSGCRYDPDNEDPAQEQYAPSASTQRLRGATCLPDGVPDHINATCSTDEDKPHGKRYHEILVYRRLLSAGQQVPHLFMTYCGRSEMNGTWTLCPPPGHAACVDDEKLMCPHPGHIHGEG